MRVPSGLRLDSPSWPLLQALISYWGTTTADGNVLGTTVLCGGLATEPPYDNHALKIISGPAAGQTRDIVTHPAGTNTLTVASAFTNAAGAAQQIVAGTNFVILSKMPAIAEIHGVFTVLPSAPNIVEPDTTQDLSLSISTVAGVPAAADLTVGTITITRVRAGAETVIVNAVACATANGRIYYDYTFPAADWQAGDEYKAVFSGQQVTVGAATYALSDIRCKGAILDWAVAIAEIAAIEAKLDLATPGATFSYLDAGGEQTIFTFTPTKDTILHTIWLDLFTLTQNSTIRLKHQIDGATYRTFETFNWTTGMDDGVYFRDIALMAGRPLQVTMQETADEAAARAVPYYYVYEERA